MTAMESRPGGEGLPEGFLELPRLVYNEDPMWIPEEPGAVERAFGPDNPWFRANRALTLCLPGKSRLAAFLASSNQIEGRSAAFFGYWETLGESLADEKLFHAAEAWARSGGAVDLYGPIDFNTFGKYRLRLAAEPGGYPFQGEPYNPTNYPAILEALGFKVYQRYLTQLANREHARALHQLKSPLKDKLLEGGYRFERLTHELWLESLTELHGLIDHIFGDNFAYTPLSREAFMGACGAGFIGKASPECSVMAYGPEGDIAGFFLVFPHYGPLIVQAAGDARVRASELNFHRHQPPLLRREFRTALAKTAGVSPKHRGKKVMDAMILTASHWGDATYRDWLPALIKVGNFSARYAARYGLPERRYALYHKEL